MRNRQWVSAWAYEQGLEDNVIRRSFKTERPTTTSTITKSFVRSLGVFTGDPTHYLRR